MNGATVAILGVLSATAGLLRLLDLPGDDAGIFFLVMLAGVAFGPRFGLLLGICSMAVSAVVTGGIGPWLPFQMLALGWMGGGAGSRRARSPRGSGRATEVVDARRRTAGCWGFLYGAVMNLWFWPFLRRRRPDVVAAGPRLLRDAAPLLVVLRRDVVRVGRRGRAAQRAAHRRSPVSR